jgi:3-oxoacyl-[acyl-carrier protein] reductase
MVEVGRLEGKVAIVTGASRGIGAAVCERFAREGARVVVNSAPEERMESLAADVVDRIVSGGGEAISVVADVSDEAQVDRMVATARDEFGDVDVMVANAATATRLPWTDFSVEEWDRIHAVNVRGTYLCARAVQEGMLRQGGGSIITVSSVMAHLGMTGSLAYVTSKAAIVGLTRALAREVGKDGIRVNAVMPGAIRTEHEVEQGRDESASAARAAERQSLPRRGYAGDLAGTFLYLASDDSAFVTGQVIAVDGGWVNR